LHICGGDAIVEGDLAGGFYVTPAIFSGCRDDMSFVRDEVFGPLMSVLSFETEDEAIEHFTQVKTVYVNLGDVSETF